MRKILILTMIGITINIISISYADSAEKYKLKYEEISQGISDKMVIFRSSEEIEGQAGFIAQPRYISQSPVYLNLPVFGKNSIRMVFDDQAGTDGKEYGAFYVDLNNDNRITDDEKIKMNLEKTDKLNIAYLNSDPVKITIKLENGTEFPYVFTVNAMCRLDEITAGNFDIKERSLYAGNININGESRKMAIAFDLFKYIKSKDISSSIKNISIDINGNGSFEPNEIYPQGQEIKIDPINILSFNFAGLSDDYKEINFDLIKKEAKHGVLSLSQYKDFKVVLAQPQERPVVFIGRDNRCAVPSGEYENVIFVVEKKDTGGNSWILQFLYKKLLRISDGQAIEAKDIEPVKAKIKVTKSRDGLIGFDMELGHKNNVALVKNKQREAPKIFILNEKNENVANAQLKYG